MPPMFVVVAEVVVRLQLSSLLTLIAPIRASDGSVLERLIYGGDGVVPFDPVMRGSFQ